MVLRLQFHLAQRGSTPLCPCFTGEKTRCLLVSSGFLGIANVVTVLFGSWPYSPPKCVVFVSKTGALRTLSITAHTDSEIGSLRGCVHSLHASVHLTSCFLPRVWQQSVGLCQLLLRNLCLSWHLSTGFAVFAVSHSVSRSSKIFSVCQIRESSAESSGP